MVARCRRRCCCSHPHTPSNSCLMLTSPDETQLITAAVMALIITHEPGQSNALIAVHPPLDSLPLQQPPHARVYFSDPPLRCRRRPYHRFPRPAPRRFHSHLPLHPCCPRLSNFPNKAVSDPYQTSHPRPPTFHTHSVPHRLASARIPPPPAATHAISPGFTTLSARLCAGSRCLHPALCTLTCGSMSPGQHGGHAGVPLCGVRPIQPLRAHGNCSDQHQRCEESRIRRYVREVLARVVLAGG